MKQLSFSSVIFLLIDHSALEYNLHIGNFLKSWLQKNSEKSISLLDLTEQNGKHLKEHSFIYA